MRTFRKVLLASVLGFSGLLVVAQLVPYGRDHSNPPARAEPAWDRPETRELAVRACFDCHSNETQWPWYSHVAPASWLLQRHVDDGRRELNFSEWPHGSGEADEAAEVVLDGEMPPRSYTLVHPEAKLSQDQRRSLAAGLEATMQSNVRPDHDDYANGD